MTGLLLSARTRLADLEGCGGEPAIDEIDVRVASDAFRAAFERYVGALGLWADEEVWPRAMLADLIADAEGPALLRIERELLG